jgi:hypothetical protein
MSQKEKKQVGENAKGEKKHSNWKRKKKWECTHLV